ncbi:MAG: DUF2157 domain-containing protein [Flavobacteriales bacterium]|nr:DUF2157 domain-containing protein [Flavobacteriales bacterium]MCC6939434.1 DUF2157 domain-containing protein [Flavobacteriales bacterium]
MAAPKLLDVLPHLVGEGLISSEQADRIRARYATDTDQGSNRMLLVFAILGSLLVGLGIILIIAHNWDDLPRVARTIIAFLPVLLGQVLVWFALERRNGNASWREGSGVLLACGLFACVALISQIYHIDGELDGYLLTCSLLILPLLYLPGSLIVTLIYLATIVWYGWLVRFDHGADHPWLMIPLIAAAVPVYLRWAKSNGVGISFWWFSLFMALGVGITSQLFYTDWEVVHVLGLVAMASAFTLVPWIHPRRVMRTWPWVLVGGATMLITFCIFSFRNVWKGVERFSDTGSDTAIILILSAIGSVAYVLSIRRRKPFEGWPYPEGWWLFLLCYGIGQFSPIAATILMNLTLLALGVFTMKHGIERDSLQRMNLGLIILSTTILMRFFDTDMSFVLRGLVFIAIGCGFLYMNVRMVRKRDRDRHEA